MVVALDMRIIIPFVFRFLGLIPRELIPTSYCDSRVLISMFNSPSYPVIIIVYNYYQYYYYVMCKVWV